MEKNVCFLYFLVLKFYSMFNLNVKCEIAQNSQSIPHNLSSLFPIEIRNHFDFHFDLQLNPKQAKDSSAALLGLRLLPDVTMTAWQ